MWENTDLQSNLLIFLYYLNRANSYLNVYCYDLIILCIYRIKLQKEVTLQPFVL